MRKLEIDGCMDTMNAFSVTGWKQSNSALDTCLRENYRNGLKRECEVVGLRPSRRIARSRLLDPSPSPVPISCQWPTLRRPCAGNLEGRHRSQRFGESSRRGDSRKWTFAGNPEGRDKSRVVADCRSPVGNPEGWHFG